MLPLNILIIGYVLITSVFIVCTKHPSNKPSTLFLVTNVLIILWESIPFILPSYSASWDIIYAWSPFLFLPILHKETGLFTSVFFVNTFDPVLIRFETRVFPYVMKFHHQNRLNSKLFSEFLHGCYLSFYFILYGIPIYFLARHEMGAFYQISFAFLLLLFSSYITHAIVPAMGPRNIFDKINDQRSSGFIFKLTHALLEAGSTRGTAFPSSHTGIAFLSLLMTWSIATPVFYFILPFAVGLIASTIYGRFHYLIDMLFSVIYAVLVFFVVQYLYR